MESEWIREERAYRLRKELKAPELSSEQRASLHAAQRAWAREGLTLGTQTCYASSARRLGRFLGKPFEDATREDLEAYLDDGMARLAPATLHAQKRFLKVFYKQLLGHEGQGHPEVVAWIRLKNPASSRKLPQDMLSTDEVRRIASGTSHPRDKAIVMVLYESAARASELVSMCVGDVEFDSYGARVTLTGKTGQRKVRIINSVPDLQVWLDNHPKRDETTAPLWLSWGHQNHHEPLLYHGLATVLRNAVKLAGIKKRVHPHLFRHSRLTELAKQLSESELKVFAGWTADSAMAKVYIHLSGDDVDRKMLEKAGLLVGEREKAPDALAMRECPRCKDKNSAANRYCSKCTMPLDPEKATELAKEQELLRARLPKLLELLEQSSSLRRL